MDWQLDGATAHPFNEGARLRVTLPDAKVEGAYWEIAVHVVVARTRLFIDRLEVQPAPGSQFIALPGIEGAVLLPGGQRVSMAQARRDITALIKDDLAHDPDRSNWPAMWRLALGFWGPDLKTPRPGRKGRTAYDHALIAAAYVEALHRDPHHVHRTMLGLLKAKDRPFSLSSLPQAVADARLHGDLTEAPAKGQAGGELTQQALTVLEEAEFDGFPTMDDRVPSTPKREGRRK